MNDGNEESFDERDMDMVRERGRVRVDVEDEEGNAAPVVRDSDRK